MKGELKRSSLQSIRCKQIKGIDRPNGTLIVSGIFGMTFADG